MNPPVRLRSEGIVQQRLDDRTVVLDLRSSLYLELNESATVLLDLVRAGSTPAQLAAALQDKWQVSRDVAEHDVAAFLRGLRERGLLEGEAHGAP